MLNRILRRYAATLPTPAPMTWHRYFQTQLDEAIEHGHPSLQVLARGLAVSPRTLQRRLAEHGTTWRAELDLARNRRAQHILQAGRPDMTRLARQLCYADSRSARRALRRWGNRSDEPTG